MSNIEWKVKAWQLFNEGYTKAAIGRKLGIARTTVRDFIKKYQDGQWQAWKESEKVAGKQGPKILFLDIETKYMLLEGWGLFNQNFSVDQIAEDWSILSYSAKFADSDEVLYSDVTEMTEDQLLQELHDLLNDADFVIAHNGRRFDMKKIRARMITRGFKPHSPVRVIDTLEIAKKEFAFTSNKLLHLTRLLCKKNQKSDHGKFAGHSLWKEFVKGNPEAIAEMREYNQIDVVSLQELYEILAPWSSTLPVFEVYQENFDNSEWVEDGFSYSNLGKYQRYRNIKTGQYRRGNKNLLTKEQRDILLRNIV